MNFQSVTPALEDAFGHIFDRIDSRRRENAAETLTDAADELGAETPEQFMQFIEDAVSNPGAPEAPGSGTYAYADDGDLATVTSDATGATVDYTSDAFGQQISDETETGTYDAYGRSVTQGPASFTYADLGNDLASTTGGPSDGSGTTTHSRDAEDQLVADGQPGDTAAASLDWSDQHGDVIGFFTSAGTATAGSNAYDPWGNLIAQAGHHADLGYQGEYTDSADGSGGTAVLMGARWYDPAAGEFQNADTAVNSPTPMSVNANLYAYAGDSPLDNTDPSGHSDRGPIEGGAGEGAGDGGTPSDDRDENGGDSGDSSRAADDPAGDAGDGEAEEGDDLRDERAEEREAEERDAAQEEQQERNEQNEQNERNDEEQEAEQQQAEEQRAQEEHAHEERAKEQRARQEARQRAEQERKAAEQRAKEEAAKRAAEQRATDARDAKANERVGKSVIEKGATGSVGGLGKFVAPAATVAATPDVTAEVAGDQASEAADQREGADSAAAEEKTSDAQNTLKNPDLLGGMTPQEIDSLARQAGYEVRPGSASAANPATRYYLPARMGRSDSESCLRALKVKAVSSLVYTFDSSVVLTPAFVCRWRVI